MRSFIRFERGGQLLCVNIRHIETIREISDTSTSIIVNGEDYRVDHSVDSVCAAVEEALKISTQK